MKRAVYNLNLKPDMVYIDGIHKPDISIDSECFIKGDQKIPEISAASIIAKVSRDKFITKLAKKFNNYGWETNCGYGTKKHLSALKKFGITYHHRKTFAPIHKI